MKTMMKKPAVKKPAMKKFAAGGFSAGPVNPAAAAAEKQQMQQQQQMKQEAAMANAQQQAMQQRATSSAPARGFGGQEAAIDMKKASQQMSMPAAPAGRRAPVAGVNQTGARRGVVPRGTMMAKGGVVAKKAVAMKGKKK